MQKLTKTSKILLSQEEVNDKMNKRLAREKRQLDRKLEDKRLEIEVMGKLAQENIPLEFAPFIMVSKNTKRTYQTLASFISAWHASVRTK
ncbi:MAG: DUF4355 domain-containing protein [Turicibacter sp.]|nr:DUF4355 domain-containing protein [Turicibacter sp.]